MTGFEEMIVIIDDERMVRESLVAFLEDEGFAVRGAASAEEALSIMEQRRVRVAVVDLRLPGMSGSDFISASAEKWPCTRFLIHTGSANFTLTPELEAAGMTDDDVFHKPVVHLETMAGRIRRLLEPDTSEDC